jgi:hypothetical protein
MRSLLGRLNQFVLAPGSLTDISVWWTWERRLEREPPKQSPWHI